MNELLEVWPKCAHVPNLIKDGPLVYTNTFAKYSKQFFDSRYIFSTYIKVTLETYDAIVLLTNSTILDHVQIAIPISTITHWEVKVWNCPSMTRLAPELVVPYLLPGIRRDGFFQCELRPLRPQTGNNLVLFRLTFKSYWSALRSSEMRIF